MKFFLVIAFLFTSLNLQASELPKDLAYQAQLGLFSTDFLLATNRLEQNVGNKEFMDKAKAEASVYDKLEASAWGGMGGVSVAAGGVGNALLFSTGHAVNRLNGAHITVFNTLATYLDPKGLKFSAMSFGPGFLLMSAGSVGLYTSAQKMGEGQVKYLINNEKADQLASGLAKDLATVAGLSKAEETTLKFALLEEMRRKAKEGDDSPVDVIKVLENAAYKGKSLLSKEELAVLDKVKEAEPRWTVKDSASLKTELMAANALMKATLETDSKIKPDALKNIKDLISKNDATITAISNFQRANRRASSGEGSQQQADPNYRSGDAE